MKTILDLTHEQAIDIAQLIYPWPDCMTNIQVVFYPYFEGHYEDADEYVKILFDGPTMADRIYNHKITIYRTLDCHYLMRPLGGGNWEIIATRNQYEIQKRFREWGVVPSVKNFRRKLVL